MKRALATQLAALEGMDAAVLRLEWERVYETLAPRLVPSLMRLGIAYRLQEQALGGLKRGYATKLHAVAKGGAMAITAKPGTRLVRSWNGRTLTVQIEKEGFIFEDRTYRSLSAIAREVTGTPWSGPRFFGLNAKAGSARVNNA